MVNAAGVHLLEPSEVEDVAHGVAEAGRAPDGDVSLDRVPSSDGDDWRDPDDADAIETAERMRREADTVRRDYARWKDQVEAACVGVVESLGSRAHESTLDALDELVEVIGRR
jgi:hypothetical protein